MMNVRVLMLFVAVTLSAAGCYSSFNPFPGPAGRDAGTTSFDATVVDTGPGPRFDAGRRDTGPGPRLDAARRDAEPRNPFTGLYEGTYAGDVSGEVFMEIRADGTLTMYLNGGSSGYEGSIRVDGRLNADGSIDGLGVTFTGRFIGEPGAHTGSGEWHMGPAGAMGTWELRQVG